MRCCSLMHMQKMWKWIVERSHLLLVFTLTSGKRNVKEIFNKKPPTVADGSCWKYVSGIDQQALLSLGVFLLISFASLLSSRDMQFTFKRCLQNSGKIHASPLCFKVEPRRNRAIFFHCAQIVLSAIFREINVNQRNDRTRLISARVAWWSLLSFQKLAINLITAKE